MARLDGSGFERVLLGHNPNPRPAVLLVDLSVDETQEQTRERLEFDTATTTLFCSRISSMETFVLRHVFDVLTSEIAARENHAK